MNRAVGKTRADKQWEQLMIASVHEAGHAIASLELGMGLQWVEVDVRTPLFLGDPYAHGETMPDSHDSDAPDEGLVVTLAGAEAEYRLYDAWGWGKWKSRREARLHAGGDRELLKKWLPSAVISVRQAEQASIELVTDYWDWILVVAEALSEAGRLSGLEVEDLL